MADTTNHRIQKFNSSGIYQAQFGGYGNGNGQFIYPQGIAVDTSGNIYVADTTNHRIQKLAEDMHEGVFSTDLNGLICNTTYHYRAYATNSEDTIWGNDATFTTAACPYPDPPTNLQATILSATTISFSWDAPTNTGDSLIDHYNFGYRKVGDNNWLTGSTDDDETTTTIPGLMPSTQYEFGVSAVNANGYDDDTLVTITATTGTPGFYLINNCQQLQDINNDLSSSYELARNIDCSDTVNWNGGAGFAPIGNPLGSTFFTGLLAGNNYSISDLYINQSGGQHAFVAPFGATMNAIFQDVRIVQPVIHGSSSGTTYVSGLAVLMVGDDAASSVTNVHIVDAELYGERVETGSPPDNEDGVVIGGLASVLNVDEVPAAHSRNEFRGTIHASGSMPSVFSGGLYGLAYGNSTIDDSYANAASNITNTLTGSDHNSFIGGLIGEASGAVNINHSYAAGSIAVNDTEPAAVSMIGGLAGDLAGGMASNSFARVSMSNSVPGVQQATGGFIGGWIDSIAPTSVNNFFDADVAGTTDCSSPLLDPLPGCTAISGQPNYFYNNTTNAPLNTWDFTNVWSTTSTLPVFDKKVLTSITAIPPSRLPGYVPPAGTVLPRASEQPTLGPVVPPKLSIRSFGEELLPPAENPPTSLIERLKQFFRNVPEVVLVSFPYAFFSLLLIGALALLIEVGLQARRLQATKLLLARQAAVAKERDTFWHLAANYLRAPITLMIGGVELLSDDKTPGIAKLQTLSKQLQTKVGVIMERIEQSKSLQGIMRPKVEAPRRVLGLLRFWVPVVAVGVLAVTINIVATSYRNINLSLINLGMQVMVFVIASLVLYWVLGALGVVSSKRKKAEAMLARQAASLDSARSEFIAQAAEDLDTDLTGLKNELDRLGNKAAATAIVYEGAHRLRELIDSFQLLVAAQNNKLGELSPKTAHANLDGIVDETLRSLSSVIAQKQLTVHKAELSGMIVPGNTLLVNQVVGSVLSNAVAFSPAKSTIELSLKQDKGSVRLVVTNQGTPIPSDELSHVFSPLTKADGYDGLQLDHDGLGVNLYIDKLIMKHLGGEIAVASSTAKGTTMVMKWPTVAVG